MQKKWRKKIESNPFCSLINMERITVFIHLHGTVNWRLQPIQCTRYTQHTTHNCDCVCIVYWDFQFVIVLELERLLSSHCTTTCSRGSKIKEENHIRKVEWNTVHAYSITRLFFHSFRNSSDFLFSVECLVLIVNLALMAFFSFITFCLYRIASLWPTDRPKDALAPKSGLW